jgi:uncharacterized protein with HEPN domain
VRSDPDRLRDILDSIRKIQERLPGEEALLHADELLQVWMVHHLQVIGEAARGISPASRAAHPEVEWTKIVAMRNILVHEYFGLDLHQVWVAVTRDLPPLARQIESLLG